MKEAGVKSWVQNRVLDFFDVFPHSSVAVNILVFHLRQSRLFTSPSLAVILTEPHASVAVALPSAETTSAGLQPSGTSS